jgi:hypothetical protein
MKIIRYIFSFTTCIFGFYDFLDLQFERVYILNFSLLLYTIIEFYNYKKTQKEINIFLSPIFAYTILVFFTNLGAYTSFLYVQNKSEIIRSEIYSSQYISDTVYLKTLAIINFAYLFSWLGFENNYGSYLFKKYCSIRLYNKIINSKINYNSLFLFFLFAYLIKFYLFSIGLFGRSLDDKYFEAGVGYKIGSELRIFSDLSFLVLFLYGYQYYKYQKFSHLIILIISFTIELIFGFISGARSPFIYPFLIIFFSEVAAKNTIPKKWLLFFPLITIFTFTIVLNYKNYSLGDYFLKSDNPFEQISDFIFKKDYLSNSNISINGGIDNFLNSSNHSQILATAINYIDNNFLNHNDPDFLESFIRVPYDAFVPKFIQGKQEFTWGLWFKNNILNHTTDLKYSIAMTSVGFSYFTGGFIFVLFIFFIQGIILNFVKNMLFLKSDFSIIYFILFFSLVIFFDSIISNYFTNFIRYLFIFPIVFYVLLAKKDNSSA